MNTTTNIHIAKRLITIDTDAWQRLQTYLLAIKNYFATQESGDEIYSDIENRISEIMHQQLKAGKVSIQDDDVQQIINTIGDLKTLGIAEPEVVNNSTNTDSSYTQNNTQNTAQSTTQNTIQNTNYTGPKKLFRNGNDKLISGLCSGIANYFNVDPIWVRLVFLLGLIPGGIGFIGYILGSIFVPKSYDAVFNNKRLYRSTDSKMIGGVCGGIAAYTHTNPLYIRLLFLSPIILGFITSGIFSDEFGFGTAAINVPFFGIYILLLILLPKARTASEKLQMSGQQINANTIRSQVTGSYVQQSSLGSVFGIIAKIILYCIVGFMLFVVAMVSIALFGGGAAFMQYADYIFSPGHQQILANCGWILVCGIPIAFIVLLIIKKFSSGFSLPKNTFSYMALAWGFGLFCLIALAREIKNDFANTKQTPNVTTSFAAYTGNTLRLQLPADDDLINYTWNHKLGSIRDYKDSIIMGNVSITIEKSLDNNFGYSTNFVTRGSNDADMQVRLNKINFVPQLKDSALVLPLGILLRKGQLWRGQKINLKIFVPENKYFLIEDNVDKAYNNVTLNTNLSNFNINTTNSFDYSTDVWYQMKNGKAYNAQSSIQDAKDAVEEAAEEIADNLGDVKNELKNKLDEAKAELNNLKDEDGTVIKDADKKVLESTITVFQNSLDSLEKIFTTHKSDKLQDAQQQLEKAKATLDSLQKTK